MKHGGDLTGAIARYGIAGEDWLDLSTGINPYAYPCPPEMPVEHAIRLPGLDRLEQLLETARTCYAVPEGASICAAPGTEILIRIQAMLVDGPTTLLPTSYRSYRDAWTNAGHQIRDAADADLGSLDNGCNIALVNPNNPDGRVVGADRLLAWARARTEPACLIVDEAFADVVPDCSIVPHLKPDDRVIVFRSFGKFYGLPGLRLGFAIGAANLVEPIRAMLGDWPVSAAALQAGIAALGDRPWQVVMRRRLNKAAEELDGILRSAGLEIAGGTALFRLARHPGATAIHERLALAGIWVRRFDEKTDLLRFGLPGSAAAARRLQTTLATVAG